MRDFQNSQDIIEREIISNSAMVNKQEMKMVRKDNGKEDVCVDELIKGVESCKINNNTNSSKSYELSEVFKNMKINDTADKYWKTGEHNSQPKEDDERGNIGIRSEEFVPIENMVTLEAPSADDNEESEDSNEKSNADDDEESLGERGPMHGVPAANCLTDISLSYQVQGNLLAGNRNYPLPSLPATFPDYSYPQTRTTLVKQGAKRGMEGNEVYMEPQKWVRQQNSDEFNNLNAPWSGLSSNMAAANTKQVTKVYHKQMSGGTVYTPKEGQCPGDQFCNGSLDNQNSLVELFEIGYEDNGLNIQVEDFLTSSEPLQTIADPGVVGLMNMGPHQWCHQQNSFPPVSHITTLNQFLQQTSGESYHPQMVQPYQNGRSNGKRGSFGNDGCSDGYGSDLSPSHDTQTPSPCSVMDRSPAYNGSSPPPSNMSQDSGVHSPMADDQNGYSMKSPRQGHVMSPPSVSSVPGTPGSTRMNMSPPHAISPPCQEQVTNEDYKNPFIDQNLPLLNCALEVASEDLQAEMIKGLIKSPVHTDFSIPISQGHYSSNLPNGNGTGCSSNGVVFNSCDMVFSENRIGLSGPPQKFSPMVVDRPSSTKSTFQTPLSTNMKPQGMPILPTTVPTVIPLTKNDTSVCQPTTKSTNQTIVRGTVMTASTNNNNNLQQFTQRTVPGPLIITTGVTTSVQPPGKIAIAPMNPKPKPTPPQMPLILANGTAVTPVILIPTKTPPKSLRPLAPKDPTKQGEKTADSNMKTTNVGNAVTNSNGANQREKATNSVMSNVKKDPGTIEKFLNLARRLVAEMSTEDMKFRDEDGDSYLHVAVCRADSCMVQALLERLLRESLTEMINSQNSQGQTPLYLAVTTNNAKMVKLLVDQGADANPFAEALTPTGHIEKKAAIHCAATKGEGYLETLMELLKAPEINLNQVNTEGHTALNCAILSHGKMTTEKITVNSIPIIRALIHAGADPNLQVQQSGKTALMYALESRDLDLIESTFQLVEPQKLNIFLKTQAFDSSTCSKIADSLKATLDPVGQQRLNNCMKPGNSRSIYGLPS